MAKQTGAERSVKRTRRRERPTDTLTRTISLLAGGAPLADILQAIVQCVEAEHPSALCGILLLDAAGQRLTHGAAPSLPEFYNKAIDGVAIGPDVGSCGAAAFSNERVVASDIRTDPRWKDYRDLAARAGLRACWSEPIRSAAGGVIGAFAMYHRRVSTPSDGDIASIVAAARLAAIAIERRRSEEALAASEARHRLFADHATDMIMLSNAARQLTYISPSVARATGYPPSLLVGRQVVDLVHPEDAPRLLAASKRLFAQGPAGEPPCTEYRARHKDGRWLWFETRTSLLTDPLTGEPTGALDVSREITARKALESELEQRSREAMAATEAKSEFLANMSHEIRTPLTAILGYSGLLSRIEGLPVEAMSHIKRITSAGEALLAVVNDVLDFSKLDAGLLELDPSPFEPRVVIGEAIDLVSAQAVIKGLTLEAEFAKAVPKAVAADSTRLRQILLNLLGNAVKFTETGGVRVSVDYQAEGEGLLRVAVTDTGSGVPADRRDRLFQRFSQVDSSVSRLHGGSGLGLAICKRLTEAMGGDIGFDSIEGRGSTFWFVVAAPPAEIGAGASEEDVALMDMPPRRLLVVDDLAVNRDLVRAILSPLGHEIAEAAGGAEAVDLAERSAFDLILMDLQMPGMDGMTATRAIRASSSRNRATPILALSADVLAGQLAACHAAGMNDHIAKPIDLNELISKVAQWSWGEAGQAAEAV
jgi:PAS domain S-box-containing protein